MMSDGEPAMRRPATTWQTVGPYFAIGLTRLLQPDIATEAVPGERILVRGRVFDGKGVPIPDALLEIWQANADGIYALQEDAPEKPFDPGFTGFGRVATGQEGQFAFSTIKPGAIPGIGSRMQAPHLAVGLMMRGLLCRLTTRIYFPGELLNESDPILHLVPPARRQTLLLKPPAIHEDFYTWEIHMQGEEETVFFDF